jgi:CheY-like chemotaxis protein
MNEPYRILLIEDEAQERDAVRAQLESETGEDGQTRFEVRVACGLADAVRVLNQWLPQAVVLDFDFSRSTGEGGLTILRRIRQYDRYVPVVMLTALLKNAEDEKAVIHEGVDFILKKGLGDPSLLVEVLLRLLRERNEVIDAMERWAKDNPEADEPKFLRADGVTLTLRQAIHEMRQRTLFGRELLDTYRLGMIGLFSARHPPEAA